MSAAKADTQLPLAEIMRQAKRNPWAVAVLVLLSGGGLTGASAWLGLATKEDVQEIKTQVAAIKVTVDKRAIQAGVEEQIRLRNLQAHAVVTNGSR